MNRNADNNVMMGKCYKLRSSAGINGLSFVGRGRVYSTITADQEKISIEMIPARKNKIPVIYFEDITRVTVNCKLAVYYTVMTLISVVFGFANPVCFACAIVFLWLGINRKITISLRSGNQAVLYSRNKKVCREFVQDLQEVSGVTGGN